MLPIHLIAAAAGGGTRVQLNATADTATDSSSPYNSSVGIRVASDGYVYSDDAINGDALSYGQRYAWIIPQAGMSGYEVRVTSVDHNAGSNPGSGWASSPGADGSWFALSSSRTWTINETAAGDYTTTATCEIRRGSLTLASATFTWRIINTP